MPKIVFEQSFTDPNCCPAAHKCEEILKGNQEVCCLCRPMAYLNLPEGDTLPAFPLCNACENFKEEFPYGLGI